MKPKIRFSHEYVKFPDKIEQRKTYLIGVSVCDIENLPQKFIHWDTLYFDYNEQKTGYYPLPKNGWFIVLMLYTSDMVVNKKAYPLEIWTTIRRFTSRKHNYYRGLIGKEVEIVIEKELKGK